MLQAEKICKRFSTVEALKQVSFELQEGSMTIFSGADGAGKSTLFKILVGLVRRDAGTIRLHGKEIGRDFESITSVCGYMPERFSLYTDLTVEENLDFFADIHQVPRQRREEMKNRMLEKTGMASFKNRRAGALSGGMKQKLALSSILLSSPELILLDEPTTGVDPLSRIEFFEILQDLKREGKTIALTTPYLDEAEKGDHVVFLKDGEVLVQDSIHSLIQHFPSRLFRLTPRGNILEAMETMVEKNEWKGRMYIRGNRLHVLHPKDKPFVSPIPDAEVSEGEPSLEDIFIYYERRMSGGKA